VPSAIYIATRSLRTGIDADSTQTIDLRLSDCDRRRDVTRSQAISLGGQVYTTYLRGTVFWTCATAPLGQERLQQMIEFLESVEDGQVFSFEPAPRVELEPFADSLRITEEGDPRITEEEDERYTAALAEVEYANLRSVIMDSTGYRMARRVKRGGNQFHDMFAFSFTLREI
jgi:hypothetical protein